MPNKAETRQIALGGRIVSYTLERKHVKNLNLRVRADGSVFVSCPRLTPQSRIDAFLYAEQRRILAALARHEQAAQGTEFRGAHLFDAARRRISRH